MTMYSNESDLLKFLVDIKSNGYDKDFASFNATNLMMHEGSINYNVDLRNGVDILVLDFIVKQDSNPMDQATFTRVVDDLIQAFSGENQPKQIELFYILNKNIIRPLYAKYIEGIIDIDSFKSAVSKYCEKDEDFEELVGLANRN